MFGIALKATWSSDPAILIQTRPNDSFVDGMSLDPDVVADNWPKSKVKVIREIQIRSTRTNRFRDAYVVRK